MFDWFIQNTKNIKYHLTSGEILEQFLHVQNSVSVISRNVVFMGMGEPLDNWNNVRNAIKGFHDKRKYLNVN